MQACINLDRMKSKTLACLRLGLIDRLNVFDFTLFEDLILKHIIHVKYDQTATETTGSLFFEEMDSDAPVLWVHLLTRVLISALFQVELVF